MKKYYSVFLLFLPLALFPLALTAQETDMSLLSGDKVWTMQYKGVLPPEYGDVYTFVETRLEGDTIIDGIHFKRKYRRIWRLGEEKPDVWTPLSEYLGQDGGKVYLCSREFYNSPLGSPQLIMDFSAEVGDDVYIGTPESNESYTVTDVSNMVIYDSDDKSTRRCLHVKYGVTIITDEWIEGIGSLLFGVSTTSPGAGAFTHLYRCVDGDKLLYQWDTIVGIGDAPRLMNNEGMNNVAGAVYDLQGRRVGYNSSETITNNRSTFLRPFGSKRAELERNLKPGVYIQNGKKIVKK